MVFYSINFIHKFIQFEKNKANWMNLRLQIKKWDVKWRGGKCVCKKFRIQI